MSTYSDGTQELPINQISSAVAADGTTRTVTLVIAESLKMGDRRRIDLAWPTIEPRTYSNAPPRGVVHLVTAGDNGAPRRGSAGSETLVDTSSDRAQLKNDMARKDG